MKICPHCRGGNEDDALVCVECGKELPVKEQRLPKLSGKTLFTGFLVLSAFILVGVWYLLQPDALVGHTGPVTSLLVSNDGRYAISGGGVGDSTIRVWDIAERRLHHVIKGQRGPVLSMALTHDDMYLVAGSDSGDQVIRTWHLASGRPVLNLPGGIAPVVVSPDKHNIAAATVSNELRVWSSDDGMLVRRLPGHTAPVLSMTVDRSGYYLLSSSLDRTLRIWSLRGATTATGTAFLRTTQSSPGLVSAIDMPFDGRYILTATMEPSDPVVQSWSVPVGRLQATLRGGHDAPISAIQIADPTSYFATGDTDGKVVLWDLDTGRPIITFRAYWAGGVRSLAFSKEADYILAGYGDGKVRIWPTPW